MSALENGGPAFPVPGLSNLPNEGFIYPEVGMTLRDYFAAKALEWSGSSEWFSKDPQQVAARAYRLADAMLKERAK